MRTLFIALVLLTAPGCTITGSVFLEKDYNTDPAVYHNPDARTRAEVSVTSKDFKGFKVF